MTFELVSIASLMLAIIFVWFPQKYLWIFAFTAFLVSGLASEWIKPASLIWMFGLALIVHVYLHAQTVIVKSVALTGLMVAAFCFGLHLVPGFGLVTCLEEMRLSDSSGWTALYFSADKPLAGLALLIACRERLCRSLSDWRSAFTVSLLPTSLGCGLVYLAGLWTGYLVVDLSFSPFVLVWLVRNLLFTVVVEELLFRQFLQGRIAVLIGGPSAKPIALLVASILFGAAHLGGGWQLGMLATLAGLVYGYVFMRSQSIEMAIMAHIALNTGHLLFFSYPFAAYYT